MIFVFLYLYLCLCICIYLFVLMYLYLCIFIHVFVSMYLYLCICICVLYVNINNAIQLMLVYTGMAADILEIFEAFRENKVNIYTQCSMFMDIVLYTHMFYCQINQKTALQKFYICKKSALFCYWFDSYESDKTTLHNMMSIWYWTLRIFSKSVIFLGDAQAATYLCRPRRLELEPLAGGNHFCFSV